MHDYGNWGKKSSASDEHSSDGATTKLADGKLGPGDAMLHALFDSHNSSLENLLQLVHRGSKRSAQCDTSDIMRLYGGEDEDDDDLSDACRARRSKRTKSASRDSDSEGSSDGGVGKVKVRREKNRLAARKCRAKKLQFMLEMDNKMRELTQKNEDMRIQMLTIQKMFSREVKLREAMKVILQARWTAANPFPGYTVNDIIIGLESGTLDVNTILNISNRSPLMSGGYTDEDCSLEPAFGGLFSLDDGTGMGVPSTFLGTCFPVREPGASFAPGLPAPLSFELVPELPLQSRPVGQCVTTGATPVPVKLEHQSAFHSFPAAAGRPTAGDASTEPVALQTIVIRGAPGAADGSPAVTTQFMMP